VVIHHESTHAEKDHFAFIDLNAFQDMRMVPDDNIGAGIYGSMPYLVLIHRDDLRDVMYAPVHGHHQHVPSGRSFFMSSIIGRQIRGIGFVTVFAEFQAPSPPARSAWTP